VAVVGDVDVDAVELVMTMEGVAAEVGTSKALAPKAVAQQQYYRSTLAEGAEVDLQGVVEEDQGVAAKVSAPAASTGTYELSRPADFQLTYRQGE
jgi:hypothetical protein